MRDQQTRDDAAYVFELCKPRITFMDRELQENTLDDHLEGMLVAAYPTSKSQRN